MTGRELFLFSLIILIWGGHFVVVRATVQDMSPPIFYAGIRMALVALLLVRFLKWHAGYMKYVLAAGLCLGSLNYLFLFSGLKYVPASIAALVIELHLPLVLLMSVLFLGEQVGWRRFSGVALAVTGTIIISMAKPPTSSHDFFYFGIVMLVMAALLDSGGAILVKMIKQIPSLELLAWFAVTGCVTLLPISFFFERDHFAVFATDARWAFIGALLYSALGASLIGHAGYYWLLRRLPIYKVAPVGLLATVFAVAGGILFLGESFTWQLGLGGSVTLAGVTIIMWRNVTKKKTSTTVTQKRPLS